MTRVWQFNPHGGGRTVPATQRGVTRTAIEDHAREHFAGRYQHIDIRFRAQFCYIDAATDPGDDHAMALCRLRFFDRDRWSFALYSYAREAYEPAVFADGDFFGPAVDAFDLAANLYLP